MKSLTMGSLFDGIGGFPLAAIHNGIIPVWASEIESFPMEVTRLRFPDMVHVGDITKLDGAELPPVDIICGGSPCQDLSVAGNRAGLSGARSGLFMEQVRLVKEMRNAERLRNRAALDIRPRFMVWENVPGAFSSGTPKGEDFRIVLEEIVRIKVGGVSVPRPDTGRWESAGRIVLGTDFSLAWRCIDAQYWGVPQRRKRIFLVADFAGRSAGQILFDQESLPGYGYNVSVIDLRNPTRSDGNNLLTLVNRYMDIARKEPRNLAARAKAEKYAKILSKTIVNPDGDDSNRGQNAFFYDAAEGLLTSVILMLAEFLPPDEDHPQERRHIVSVFKLVQDLLEPSGIKGKSHFQLLMGKLPPDHKARWFAGAALNSAEQAMASVMSTVLSRLNAFLDSELEQILCFDSAIDAEKFASEKSAIFLILPEEDTTKNFMAGLMIQNLSRELFAVADENGGKLKNRVVLFCDEFGTMPPFDILPLFSAGRSRRLTLVPIIQSLAQLEKNYGKEGCEIIQDNCQDTIFGGFAPNSQTAEVLSKALGSRTVLSGSVSRGKNDPSQSLQMMERALLTPDELKSIPKGSFIVMKTGTHPMRTRLQLFLNWGITFGEPYTVPERANRAVAYANRVDLERNLPKSDKSVEAEEYRGYAVAGHGGMVQTPAQEKSHKYGKGMKTFEKEEL